MSAKQVKITVQGRTFNYSGDKSLLDFLLEHGVNIPHGCKNGICLNCKSIASKGNPPPRSTHSLSVSDKTAGAFLPCLCFPDEDLEVCETTGNTASSFARIQSIELLTPKVLRVLLEAEKTLEVSPGQHIDVFRPDGLSRTYSIASQETRILELHVQLVPGGQMSSWFAQQAQAGQMLKLSEARGECCYQMQFAERPLLLICTGTGLAPLYAVLNDALRLGHSKDIFLYHGSSSAHGLYLERDLAQLQLSHTRFNYIPCVSREEGDFFRRHGRASDLALQDFTDLRGWEVFLAGSPSMIESTKKKVYLAGASLSSIHTDPFYSGTVSLQQVQQ